MSIRSRLGEAVSILLWNLSLYLLHSAVALVAPRPDAGSHRWLWQRYLRGWGGIEAAENEMPAADLHASTGSPHIIKPRGRLQWLHLCPGPHRLHQGPTRWFISAVSLTGFFPPRERWGGWWDLRMYMRWNSFWEEHMLPLTERTLLSFSFFCRAPVSVLSSTRFPATHSSTVPGVRISDGCSCAQCL